MALASASFAASVGSAVAWSAGVRRSENGNSDCQLARGLSRSVQQQPCQAPACAPAAPSQALGSAARNSSGATYAALLATTAAAVRGGSARRQWQQLPALAAARASGGRSRSSGSSASSSSSPKRGRKSPSQKQEDVVDKGPSSDSAKKLLKELIQEVPDGLGRDADASVKVRIEEAAMELEELNRVMSPAKSEGMMLSGKWKLLYSSADAISAGVFAFGWLKGKASQKIDAKLRQQVSRVAFFGGICALNWTSNLRAMGNIDVSPGKENWNFELFGFQIPMLSAEWRGTLTWTLSYTDSAFRIVRTEKPDPLGVPMTDLYVYEKM